MSAHRNRLLSRYSGLLPTVGMSYAPMCDAEPPRSAQRACCRAREKRQEHGEGEPIELQKYLKGLDYPAQKAAIVKQARGHDAPEDIMKTLGALPEREYETPASISKAVGQVE